MQVKELMEFLKDVDGEMFIYVCGSEKGIEEDTLPSIEAAYVVNTSDDRHYVALKY